MNKEKIINWYNKFCYDHKIENDLYDINAYIDSTLTEEENINIIEEDLKKLAENGTLDRENFKRIKAQQEQENKKCALKKHLNTMKILSNSLTLVMGRSNEAKTSLLCELIADYTKNYDGLVFVYGLKEELTNKLNVKTFNSLLELEQIKDSIVIVDEMRVLFDIENRKMTPFIDNILRRINHNNNKLVLCGLPSDFKKYICAKGTAFIYKSLDYTDLINGSRAKEIIMMYKGSEAGAYTLDLKKSESLFYDGNEFEKIVLPFNTEWDTKRNNKNLFIQKSLKKSENVPENVPKALIEVKNNG